MAYVDLEKRARGPVAAFARWYSRRKFGEVADPLRAAGRHPGVAMAWGAFELLAERRWRRLDPGLRVLAVHRVSTAIGCPWCIDFGTWEGSRLGVDPAKLAGIGDWRGDDAYDERERAVLAFAETATQTPAAVTEDLVAPLRELLGDEAVVELAAWVAIENYRSRFNAGLGLGSQGFAARCARPVPTGGG
jgi:alkylhydroperoxidase family enzyme